MQDEKTKKILSDLFDEIEKSKNIELEDNRFAETMQMLGFDMDCYQSFNAYAQKCGVDVSKFKSDDEKLALLSSAPVSVVGDYLFSYWRMLTHWSYGYGKEAVTHLLCVLKILCDR